MDLINLLQKIKDTHTHTHIFLEFWYLKNDKSCHQFFNLFYFLFYANMIYI
jgi:hypothetical protein